MQDQYVGDVGDFGNNGLLRWLCGKPEVESGEDSTGGKLQLGVVWYFKSNSGIGGRLIGYLKDPERFQECDSHLYKVLGGLVPNHRKVSALEKSGILPCETYYRSELSYALDESVELREESRAKWVAGAVEKIKSAEIIFLDPDNGIACDCACQCPTPFTKASTKYAYVDDLIRFAGEGKSLVIYHHLPRVADFDHRQQIHRLATRLERELGLHTSALLFRGGNRRAYFIAAQPGKHRHIIEKRLEGFYESPWCEKKRRLFVPVV